MKRLRFHRDGECKKLAARKWFGTGMAWLHNLLMMYVVIVLLLGITCNWIPGVKQLVVSLAPMLEPLCALPSGEIALILGTLLTYLGFTFQRQYHKRQVWERIQERLRQEGLTFALLHEWKRSGFAGDEAYALLRPGEWLPWFSQALLEYPFTQLVHGDRFHTDVRVFLQMARCLDSAAMAPLWQALLDMEHHLESVLQHRLRVLLNWWHQENYRPDVWPVLVWVLWWMWERGNWKEKQTEKQTRNAATRNLPSFCEEVQKVLEAVARQTGMADPYLVSLMMDEVLQRAGIRCSKIAVPAYRPKRTWWHHYWTQYWQPRLARGYGFFEVAEVPQDWPWPPDAPNDPEAHLVLVADHPYDRWWAMQGLYAVWEHRKEFLFPVVIDDLDTETLWQNLADTWLYWIAPERNPWAFWALAGHNQERLFCLFRQAYGSQVVMRQRLWELWLMAKGATSHKDPALVWRGSAHERALMARWCVTEPLPESLAHQVATYLVTPPPVRDRPWRVWFVLDPERLAGPIALRAEETLRELWKHLAYRDAFLRAVLPQDLGEQVARRIGTGWLRLTWTREALERSWARWLRANRGQSPESEVPWDILLEPAQRERVMEALEQARGSLGRFLEGVLPLMERLERERRDR